MKENEIKEVVDSAMQVNLQNLYSYMMNKDLPKLTGDYEDVKNQHSRYLACAKYLGYAHATGLILSEGINSLMASVPLEKMEESTLEHLKEIQSTLIGSLPQYKDMEYLRNACYYNSPRVFSFYDFCHGSEIKQLIEDANINGVGFGTKQIEDAYRSAFDEMRDSFKRMIDDKKVSTFFSQSRDHSRLEILKDETLKLDSEEIRNLQHRLITYYEAVNSKACYDLRVSKKLFPENPPTYDYSALASDLGFSINTSGFDHLIERVKPFNQHKI